MFPFLEQAAQFQGPKQILFILLKVYPPLGAKKKQGPKHPNKGQLHRLVDPVVLAWVVPTGEVVITKGRLAKLRKQYPPKMAGVNQVQPRIGDRALVVTVPRCVPS